jgi:hypothetical protein
MPQKIEKTAHFSEPPFDAMVLTAWKWLNQLKMCPKSKP